MADSDSSKGGGGGGGGGKFWRPGVSSAICELRTISTCAVLAPSLLYSAEQ